MLSFRTLQRCFYWEWFSQAVEFPSCFLLSYSNGNCSIIYWVHNTLLTAFVIHLNELLWMQYAYMIELWIYTLTVLLETSSQLTKLKAFHTTFCCKIFASGSINRTYCYLSDICTFIINFQCALGQSSHTNKYSAWFWL
jgi:hypothetical protein